MKLYVKTVMFWMIILMVQAFVLPVLISAKSTPLVILGFFLLFMTPYVIYKGYKQFIKELKGEEK